MSFFRAVFFTILVTLMVSFGLFFLRFSAEGAGNFVAGAGEEFRGGYAILSTYADVNDRDVLSLLENCEYLGGSPVSESSLWVLLDNFDSVDVIPLDAYFNKVFPFDPRYDGYAEQLRDVFLKDDKRFFYIPLSADNWNSSLIDKQLSSLLGDISFSVDYYGTGRPYEFFLFLYIAASVCFIVLCCVKKGSNNNFNNILSFTVLIPVFSPLAFFGASGLGCASLFLALFILLREPLNDISNLNSSSFKKKAAGFKKRLKLFYKEFIAPYRYYAVFLPVFAVCFAVIIVFSQLHFWFLLLTFICALFVFIFSVKIFSFVSVKRRRFSPVMIIKRAASGFAFPVYMLPFAAAAIAAFLLSPFQTGEYVFNKNFDSFVYEEDYHRHIAYQSSFSISSINAHSSSKSVFTEFFADTDGFPSMRTIGAKNHFNYHDYPPFPLKDMMEFFEGVNSGKRKNSGTGGNSEKLILAMLAFFILICFIINRKSFSLQNADFSGLKNFSKKMPQKGINRNMTPMYNERNHKRLIKIGLKI